MNELNTYEINIRLNALKLAPISHLSEMPNLTAIRKAYKKQALEFHPDKNPNQTPESLAKFHTVQTAYEFLCGASDKISPELSPQSQSAPQKTPAMSVDQWKLPQAIHIVDYAGQSTEFYSCMYWFKTTIDRMGVSLQYRFRSDNKLLNPGLVLKAICESIIALNSLHYPSIKNSREATSSLTYYSSSSSESVDDLQIASSSTSVSSNEEIDALAALLGVRWISCGKMIQAAQSKPLTLQEMNLLSIGGHIVLRRREAALELEAPSTLPLQDISYDTLKDTPDLGDDFRGFLSSSCREYRLTLAQNLAGGRQDVNPMDTRSFWEMLPPLQQTFLIGEFHQLNNPQNALAIQVVDSSKVPANIVTKNLLRFADLPDEVKELLPMVADGLSSEVWNASTRDQKQFYLNAIGVDINSLEKNVQSSKASSAIAPHSAQFKPAATAPAKVPAKTPAITPAPEDKKCSLQ